MLTFVTGVVDAVSFLALGSVFAAMQTGNVIFLGLGAAGGPNPATTVLNLTLTAFAASSPLGFASGAELAERAAGLALILAGAFTGALLVKAGTALPLALAAIVTLAAAFELRSASSVADA